MKFLFRLNGTDGGCAACPNAAGVAGFPETLLAGTPYVLPGGIAGFALLRSDISFTDVTSESEWETKITAGTLLLRMNGCRVRGSKPDDTLTNRRRGACGVEEEIKRNQTWEIIDVGNDDDFSMYDLYEYLRATYSCYTIGFVTCDYRLHGFIAPDSESPLAGKLMPIIALSPNDNIPETNEDDAQLKMSVTTQQPGLVKPVALPFLPNVTGMIN